MTCLMYFSCFLYFVATSSKFNLDSHLMSLNKLCTSSSSLLVFLLSSSISFFEFPKFLYLKLPLFFTKPCCSTSKSRKENPQKLTQLSSRSHPRHLVGKRTAQKDITIDTTSDNQVNSNFPNRWSPASLTTIFTYFYI